MTQLESFKLDDTTVTAPYVQKAEKQKGPKGDIVSKYHIRLVHPNEESISISVFPTLKHFIELHIRDYIVDEFIDISSMDCKTGFCLILFGDKEIDEIQEVFIELLERIVKLENLPHNLDAKGFAQMILKQYKGKKI